MIGHVCVICYFSCRNNSSVPTLDIWTSDAPISLPLEGLNSPVDATKTTPYERKFEPYDFNGGYVL